MKIAQVSHNYLPHIGGLEFYIYRLVRDLKSSGNQVEVLVTDVDTLETNRKKEAKYFKSNISFMRNPLSVDLARHLKNNDYNIIHVHDFWFIPGLTAAFFKKKAKLITTLHGVYPDNASYLLRFFLGLYKPLAKYVLNKSDKIIVLSNSEKQKLIDIFRVNPKKIDVIPNGIDLEPFKKTKKDNSILFTGRIIQDKNPDLLINAAGILNKTSQEFKVVLIGPIEKSYKKELLELAEKNNIQGKIIFIDSLDQSKKEEKERFMNYYRKASAFVSLGSWEGLPTRLMEAMQFETPCIAYSAGGSSELVKNNENGFIIDKLDENQLADKIKIILANKKLAEKLGKNARKTILHDFDWSKISKKILEVYGG